jgi:predicted porin
MAAYRPSHFGTLTFGRQRALGTDAMLAYDPAGGAYSFSFIGYNGLMAGGGDTQDTRWDDAMKYRVTYGPVHFGAMYKFVDGSGRLLLRLGRLDCRHLYAGSGA